MKKIIVITLILSLFSLSACSNKPKELLAPCNWENRGSCGSIVAISHQEQL